MDPYLYTIAETCRLLSIHRNTVAALVKRGELKQVYVGAVEDPTRKRRGVRITAESVDVYINKIKKEDTTDA